MIDKELSARVTSSLQNLSRDIAKIAISNPVLAGRTKKKAQALPEKRINLMPHTQHNDELAKAIQTLQTALTIPASLSKQLSRYAETISAVQLIGLLPHATTPWHLYDTVAPDDLADEILRYYKKDWHKVESELTNTLESYAISDAAKSAYQDALTCHKNGLFRSAVLTVLPTVEREFRRQYSLTPQQAAASLQEIREFALTTPTDIAAFELFRALDEHMYTHVKTEEALRKFQQSAIPNRHAAIHGLIDYSEEQHSLNALFMADYILWVIDQKNRPVDPQDA